tara:strand:+ start:477 stop:899 length:423 start_codon:yes stop_codon:yes gene_type:complete
MGHCIEKPSQVKMGWRPEKFPSILKIPLNAQIFSLKKRVNYRFILIVNIFGFLSKILSSGADRYGEAKYYRSFLTGEIQNGISNSIRRCISTTSDRRNKNRKVKMSTSVSRLRSRALKKPPPAPMLLKLPATTLILLFNL